MPVLTDMVNFGPANDSTLAIEPSVSASAKQYSAARISLSVAALPAGITARPSIGLMHMYTFWPCLFMAAACCTASSIWLMAKRCTLTPRLLLMQRSSISGAAPTSAQRSAKLAQPCVMYSKKDLICSGFDCVFWSCVLLSAMRVTPLPLCCLN